MEKLLNVRVVLPSGVYDEFKCDSLVLDAVDCKNDKGGSFGVHFGHADAISALSEKPIFAYIEGQEIKRFALVGAISFITRDKIEIIALSVK